MSYYDAEHAHVVWGNVTLQQKGQVWYWKRVIFRPVLSSGFTMLLMNCSHHMKVNEKNLAGGNSGGGFVKMNSCSPLSVPFWRMIFGLNSFFQLLAYDKLNFAGLHQHRHSNSPHQVSSLAASIPGLHKRNLRPHLLQCKPYHKPESIFLSLSFSSGCTHSSTCIHSCVDAWVSQSRTHEDILTNSGDPPTCKTQPQKSPFFSLALCLSNFLSLCFTLQRRKRCKSFFQET